MFARHLASENACLNQPAQPVHAIDLIAKPGQLLSNENAAYIDV